MNDVSAIQNDVQKHGFAIVPQVFNDDEITKLTTAIENADSQKNTFRKTGDLFAIRQFFKEIPEAGAIVFNEYFRKLVQDIFGDDYFVVKGIYFDKPGRSNWFVAYHQDLTISVDKKTDVPGFGPWTVKQNQFAVQPPLPVLQDNFTIRVHLDDADEYNGALKVIPGSHNKNIYRAETIDWNKEKEITCAVEKGGIMIMKPLLLHASSRTTNGKQRRVLHIEFSRCALPGGLSWSEKFDYN